MPRLDDELGHRRIGTTVAAVIEHPHRPSIRKAYAPRSLNLEHEEIDRIAQVDKRPCPLPDCSILYGCTVGVRLEAPPGVARAARNIGSRPGFVSPGARLTRSSGRARAGVVKPGPAARAPVSSGSK